MIEIDPGHFVDINMIEAIEQNGSAFFIHMLSGRMQMVSPSVFMRVREVKKSLDAIKTEQTF